MIPVPVRVREEVDERDGGVCRFCGKYLGDRRVLHHIRYGGDDVGIGGRRNHVCENLITLCGEFDNGCHSTAHNNKKLWQPILIALTKYTGVTALQLQRWER
jgi:5-methylcytosine-specific restriction endonuclease McrA